VNFNKHLPKPGLYILSGLESIRTCVVRYIYICCEKNSVDRK